MKGYYLKVVPEGDSHSFCGEHHIEGAKCPNCKKPLLRFLTLNLNDSKLAINLSGIEYLHCLYCWTCELSQEPFYYELLNNDSVKLLQYRSGKSYDDFPYTNYPSFFPKKDITLQEINKKEQKEIIELNTGVADEWEIMQSNPELCKPHNQIGGVPFMSGDIETLTCPCCHNNDMEFIASICDDESNNLCFVDNEYVQVLFFLCEQCKIIGAVHQVD